MNIDYELSVEDAKLLLDSVFKCWINDTCDIEDLNLAKKQYQHCKERDARSFEDINDFAP